MRRHLRLIIILLIIVGLGAFGGWYLYAKNNTKTKFRTAKAERGDLLATISATGTIQPEDVIDVGAQVNGMIHKLGVDAKSITGLVDYRSEVDVDTVLAEIDPALYKAASDQAMADLGQAEANVKQAEANVKRAEADLLSMRSKLNQTKRDWDRVQKLKDTKALSEFDIDTARNAWETATAAIPGGEAAVKQAEAAVEQAKAAVKKSTAALNQANVNLGYCTIKSKVKGVIIDRRINVGQTVVASLNAPSLFLIAKDLRKIMVWASVNEADIGNIKKGQNVNFTVDAYPGKKFKGVVVQIRLNANMTQNVVTYTVLVRTDNPDGMLLPYQTANLSFEIDKHTNVLLVPNTALRWLPQPQQVAEDARGAFMQSRRQQSGQAQGETPKPEKDTHDKGRVWIEDGGFVRPLNVKIGLSDGVMTEIRGGDVKEDMAIVIGEARQNGAGGGTSNPFSPQMFRPKNQ